MNQLTTKIAQDIILEISKSVSNEIYITDLFGRIIAGGDVTRIGKLHLGAVTSLNTRTIARIWVETDDKRTGISIPIVFSSVIIGALSVDGNVHEIDTIILLLKTSVEMLVHQKLMSDSHRHHKQMREHFLQEWIHNTEDYSREFSSRGLYLGINVHIPRMATVVHIPNAKKVNACVERIRTLLENDDVLVRLTEDKLALLLVDNAKLQYKIKRVLNVNSSVRVASSRVSMHMYPALTQAQRALDIGLTLLNDERLLHFDDIQFMDILASNRHKEEMVMVIEKLAVAGRGSHLLQTLNTYIRFNGDIQMTVDALHIHRNSLQYRMKRIFEITGRNPRKLIDLLYLYSAYIAYALNDESGD